VKNICFPITTGSFACAMMVFYDFECRASERMDGVRCKKKKQGKNVLWEQKHFFLDRVTHARVPRLSSGVLCVPRLEYGMSERPRCVFSCFCGKAFKSI